MKGFRLGCAVKTTIIQILAIAQAWDHVSILIARVNFWRMTA